jgi:AcrR family transcriptional regulator
MGDAREFKGLDKSIRKQKIIEVAATLFCKKGYQSTSLDDVAKQIGISKAAIYHYVSSKDDLLSIIYTQAFERVFQETYKIWRMDLPPDEKLRKIIGNHVKNIIVKDLSMFSVFFSEESQLPEKDFQKIREEKKRYTRIIEEIIEEGIAKGLFRALDPKLQAYAILGMCNWVYTWYRPEKTSHDPEVIVNNFMTLLEIGYLKGDTEDTPAVRDCTAREDRGKVKLYKEIKHQCGILTSLIERV